MKEMPEMMKSCMSMMKECGCMEKMGKMDGPGFEEMMMKMNKRNEHTEDIAKYATPELRTLFEDWLIQLEDEIISFAKDKEKISPDDVANEFKVSKESAIFVLGKLAQKGKINIDGMPS